MQENKKNTSPVPILNKKKQKRLCKEDKSNLLDNEKLNLWNSHKQQLSD